MFIDPWPRCFLGGGDKDIKLQVEDKSLDTQRTKQKATKIRRQKKNGRPILLVGAKGRIQEDLTLHHLQPSPTQLLPFSRGINTVGRGSFLLVWAHPHPDSYVASGLPLA